MVSLLPPTSNIDLHYRRQYLDERTIAKYDAVIVVCLARDADKLVKQMPHASMWRKLQALTHLSGATPPLHARLSNSAVTSMTIGFAQDIATPFSCLTLAGKLVKESKLSSHCLDRGRVLLATMGFDEPQARRVQEALVAATLAAVAPLPEFKSTPTRATSLREITVLHAGSKPDFSTTLATNAGNHLARWLTTLPPNHLNCKATCKR